MAIGVNAARRFRCSSPSSMSSDGNAASRRAFSFRLSGFPAPSVLDRPHDGSLWSTSVMELGVALMAGGLLLAPLTTRHGICI